MLQFEFFDNSIPNEKLVTLLNESDTDTEKESIFSNTEELEFEEVQELELDSTPLVEPKPKPQLSRNAIAEFDFKKFVQQNGFIALIVTGMFYLVFSKDINFHFSMENNGEKMELQNTSNQELFVANKSDAAQKDSKLTAFSLWMPWGKKTEKSSPNSPQKSNIKPPKKAPKSNAANNFANISIIMANDLKGRYGLSDKEMEDKKLICTNYIKRFSSVAQAEMKRYGIPASITLAQALLESDAGGSRLSTQNNNHFGMKCFSKNCKKGHCSNFTDDTHKDFFRKYNNAWESFRAHSKLLRNKRYGHLQLLGTKNYKDWAKGLQKAGYATDKKYAEKLIKIIERTELWRLDE